MAGIYFDKDAFVARMIDDFNELFGPFGLHCDGVVQIEPRKSFWQRLREEIQNRPKVF